MKKIIFILIAGSLLLCGCKSKKSYTSWENVYDTGTPVTEEVTPVVVETPVSVVVVEEEVPEVEVRVQTEVVTVTYGEAEKYCVIVGSFANEDNATRLLSKLQSEGYSTASIMKNAQGMSRVSCASYDTERAARAKLAEARLAYPDAWLLIRQ